MLRRARAAHVPEPVGEAGLAAVLERTRAANQRLREVVDGLHAQLEAKDAQITALAERVAQLERQQRRDSSSSLKPPSSDSPYAKRRKDRSLRGKSGRRPGKQPGAPGRTLGLSDDPSESTECVPAECSRCGTGLAGEPAAGIRRRQVWDIAPPPPPVVREFRLVSKVCPHTPHRRRLNQLRHAADLPAAQKLIRAE
jgi:Family of unknown function (DUF6444)